MRVAIIGAARGADALMLLTEWDEFRGVELAELKKSMRGNLALDGRTMWHPEDVRKNGFVYHSIGRV